MGGRGDGLDEVRGWDSTYCMLRPSDFWTPDFISNLTQHPSIVDATRISDGETVILKRFSRTRDPDEKNISMFLSSEPAKSHPRNHSILLYEVLDVPRTDNSILVLPLMTRFYQPEFETVGEVLECFRQIFEVMTTPSPRTHPCSLLPLIFIRD